MESDDPMDADDHWRKIRRGWAFGSEEFRSKVQQSLDAVIRGKRRDSFMGEEMRAHDEQEAERLFQLGLLCCGLSEGKLPALKKGDDRKKVIAWHIRRNTSVRTEWITSRLCMGVTSNFSRHIRSVDLAQDGLLADLKLKMTT